LKTLSSEELCQAVKGCFLKKVNKKGFQGVTIDSRDKDISNKIFFAISGKRFDGHDFIPEVLKKNVGAIIVHRSLKPYFWEEKKNAHPVIIQVKDTLTSLRDLASFWRKKTRLEVIGITGSSGKTTTKHLCFQLLQDNFSVMASPKSFNNQYGVPLSLLSVQEGKNYLIQEIGINRKGEIQGLCDIARPHIATVVTVGSAHIELFGSKENIAKEKEYIYKSLPSEGVAVFNKDNSYTTSMYENRKKFSVSHFLVFSSRDPTADVFLKIDQVHAQAV